MRTVKSPSDFFDLLDQVGNNKFVTIGYVTGANLDVPKVKRKNPATNRMKSYDDYSVFKGEGENEIGALIKVTSYNFRYLNRTTVNKKYGEYKNNVDAIRQEFGLEPTQRKESYKTANNWGKHGIENYSGQKEELQGHTYNPQNINGARKKSTIYAVDAEGNIIKALSNEAILPYLKSKNQEPSGTSALRKMNVEEEQIQQYIQKIKDLKFNYINFEADSVLYMAATVDGEKIVYINSSVKRIVNEININQSDFVAIAQERYRKDIAELQEAYRKAAGVLSEKGVHKLIKESVRRVLKEEYDLDALKSKFAFEDSVNAVKGILFVLNNWIHYASVNSSGTNQQPYRASVITNYRNEIRQYLDKINDQQLRNEIASMLKPLFAVQRGSFNEAITVIQQIGSQIVQKYNELKSQMSNFA